MDINVTSVLEFNLFWKTVREVICPKTEWPLSAEMRVTTHTGISKKVLSRRELRRQFCYTAEPFPLGTTRSRTELVENQEVRDLRCDCNFSLG